MLALRRYVAGLAAMPPTSKPINRRNVELIRLFQVWSDLLGDAHANLLREDASFFRTDDYFYHAQGLAHVMHHLLLAVDARVRDRLRRPARRARRSSTRAAESLGRAAAMKPVVVIDGSSDGLFANHRRNLDVYLVDARQLIYSIREELEK